MIWKESGEMEKALEKKNFKDLPEKFPEKNFPGNFSLLLAAW